MLGGLQGSSVRLVPPELPDLSKLTSDLVVSFQGLFVMYIYMESLFPSFMADR